MSPNNRLPWCCTDLIRPIQIIRFGF